MKAGDLETWVNELNTEISITRISFNNLKRNFEEMKAGDLYDLKEENSEIKERLDNSERSVSKPKKKIMTAEEITEDEPPCENCRKNPCLDGEPVTIENFVDGAHFTGKTDRNTVYGFTHVGEDKKHRGGVYQGKWIKHYDYEGSHIILY